MTTQLDNHLVKSIINVHTKSQAEVTAMLQLSVVKLIYTTLEYSNDVSISYCDRNSGESHVTGTISSSNTGCRVQRNPTHNTFINYVGDLYHYIFTHYTTNEGQVAYIGLIETLRQLLYVTGQPHTSTFLQLYILDTPPSTTHRNTSCHQMSNVHMDLINRLQSIVKEFVYYQLHAGIKPAPYASGAATKTTQHERALLTILKTLYNLTDTTPSVNTTVAHNTSLPEHSNGIHTTPCIDIISDIFLFPPSGESSSSRTVPAFKSSVKQRTLAISFLASKFCTITTTPCTNTSQEQHNIDTYMQHQQRLRQRTVALMCDLTMLDTSDTVRLHAYILLMEACDIQVPNHTGASTSISSSTMNTQQNNTNDAGNTTNTNPAESLTLEILKIIILKTRDKCIKLSEIAVKTLLSNIGVQGVCHILKKYTPIPSTTTATHIDSPNAPDICNSMRDIVRTITQVREAKHRMLMYNSIITRFY